MPYMFRSKKHIEEAVGFATDRFVPRTLSIGVRALSIKLHN
jgi:hypothetical protein